MSLIKSILAFILTIAIAAFCIINAQNVDVTWSPINNSISLPLYAIILGSLITGFFIGSFSVWLNSGTLRKTKRQQKKQIKSLEKELSKTPNTIANQTPPADFFPAISHKTNP